MLQVKKILSLVVFTLLMLIKVSALHVYTHHQDDCDAVENCEICDIVLDIQSSDVEIPSQFVPLASQSIVQEEVSIKYIQTFTGNSNLHQLFSRPPPFTV